MLRSFIDEMARKNPDQNPRISAYEQIIQKGYDTKDYFFTFTNLKKVGIKPTSGYNTPNGIYTYPAMEILPSLYGNMQNVPFVDKAPYIHVLKKRGSGIVDPLESYSSGNLKSDIKKIMKMIRGNQYHNDSLETYYANIIADAIKGADNNTPIAKIWNVTKELSSDTYFSELMGWGGVKDSKYKDWYDTNVLLKQVKKKGGGWKSVRRPKGERKAIDLSRSGVQFNSQGWNNLLRKLGYNAFVDRSGSGTIHINEPTQAVFLSKKSFDVVDMIYNKTYERLTMQSKYQEYLDKFDMYNNKISMSKDLDHKSEEIFYALAKGDVRYCKISFFQGKVIIDGDGGGFISDVTLRDKNITLKEVSIMGGHYTGLTVDTCFVKGGVLYDCDVIDPEIVGGRLNKCNLTKVDVISNAEIQNCPNQLSKIAFFKCGLERLNMTDCAYTDCHISGGSINGRDAHVILDGTDNVNNMKVTVDIYRAKINGGTYQSCKFRETIINDGIFSKCRVIESEIKGGEFKSCIVDPDVKVSQGVKVDGL